MKFLSPRKISFSRIKTKDLIRSLEKLYKISIKLGTSLNLNKTLSLISESLLDITDFNICNIFLLDNEDTNYATCKFMSDKRRFFGKERVYLPESFQLKKVFREKKPLYYWDLESREEEDPALLEFLRKNKICCSMFLPLINVDVIGVVVLDKIGNFYCSENKRLDKNIFILLNQAAVAIDNAIMHETIKSERDKWYEIFNNSSNGIIIINRDFKIIDANDSFLKMLNINLEDLKEKDVLDIFLDEKEKKEVELEIRKGFLEQKPKRYKREVILNGNDESISVSLKLSFLKNLDIDPVAILSFEDITKIKELEQSKNDFISIVSHELRSPLTIIKGFLSLLSKREYGTLKAKQIHFLNRAIQSSEKLSKILEDILDVNRINIGKLTLSLEPVNLLGEITLVKKDLVSKLKEKKLKVLIKKDDQIPFILADKNRLYQILFNLLDNAIKYSFPKSIIKISFTKSNDELILSITDTGIGMSSSEQKKVFEKFSRLENSLSTATSGVGLGLYIVKNLVKAHGGKIWMESKKGVGTTVKISFKVAKQLRLLK